MDEKPCAFQNDKNQKDKEEKIIKRKKKHTHTNTYTK